MAKKDKNILRGTDTPTIAEEIRRSETEPKPEEKTPETVVSTETGKTVDYREEVEKLKKEREENRRKEKERKDREEKIREEAKKAGIDLTEPKPEKLSRRETISDYIVSLPAGTVISLSVLNEKTDDIFSEKRRDGKKNRKENLTVTDNIAEVAVRFGFLTVSPNVKETFLRTELSLPKPEKTEEKTGEEKTG
jgi:arginyl-tRNA synthetase